MLNYPGNLPRSQVKLKAIELRIRKYGQIGNSCPCDYCRIRPATDLHELVSRNRTMADDAVRKLSFAPEICSLVCQVCHVETMIVTTAAGQQSLLERNIETYGYERVQAAFLAIPPLYRIGIELPKSC